MLDAEKKQQKNIEMTEKNMGYVSTRHNERALLHPKNVGRIRGLPKTSSFGILLIQLRTTSSSTFTTPEKLQASQIAWKS